MKLVHQRTIDKVIGTPLTRFLSLFPWRYRRVPAPFRPRKILVIMLSEMGTLVLAKPMFDLLQEKYPSASIHLLVFEKNRGVLDVLKLVPGPNVLTIDDRSFRTFFQDSLRVLTALHRIRIDTVIDCELFSRVSSLFSLMSGARVRVGFESHTQEGLYRGGFINRPVLYNPYAHISLQLMVMAESLGGQGMPLVKTRLEKPVARFAPTLDPQERRRFDDRVEADFPLLKTMDFVLVYPGGGLLPIRAWPLGHYSRLVKGLLQRGHAVGIIGTGEDRPLAEELRRACPDPRCMDLTGYTRSVKELLFLLQGSRLLIGNDGGPAHFASICSTPTIVFYGPETPTLYAPLGKEVHPLHIPMACSPCLTAYNHRRSPCDGNNVCLKLISPEAVLERALGLIEGPGEKRAPVRLRA